MICPKCGYQRTIADDPLIPDYQCPACGIIYLKYQQQLSNYPKPSTDNPIRPTNINDNRIIQHPKLIKIFCALLMITVLYKCNDDYKEYRKKLDREQAAIEYKQHIKELTKQTRHIEYEKALQVHAAQCKLDATCTGKNLIISIGLNCQKSIEHLSKYIFKWTDGWLESKFNIFSWKDASKQSIVAFGDKIELQNGFGAWQNHIYACEIRVSDGIVLNVGANPGRL